MAELPVDPELVPLDRLPERDPARPGADTRRPWGGDPVTLPTGATVLAWSVGVSDVLFTAWLAAARTGVLRPSGWPFDVATLGNLDLVLVMAVVNGLIVVGLALPTRGLTRMSSLPLGLLVVGGTCGAIALLGVAALLVITALVVGVLVGVLAFAATRI